MKKSVFLVIVVAGLLAGMAAGVALRNSETATRSSLASAVVLSAPRSLPEFRLQAEGGLSITNEDLQGHWTLVFFGFTNCPDVCPTTLATLNRVIEILAADATRRAPQVLFVSVDPMRDTPEKIGAYVKFFNPAFKGATGDTLMLQSLSRAMSVAYEYRPLDSGDGYTVDHTSAVLLVNPDANLHAIFSTPHKAASIAHDLAAIADARR